MSSLIDPISLFVASGVQERDVRCILTSDNSVVSDKACDLFTKPPSSQECNMQACAPEYVINIYVVNFSSKSRRKLREKSLLVCMLARFRRVAIAGNTIMETEFKGMGCWMQFSPFKVAQNNFQQLNVDGSL